MKNTIGIVVAVLLVVVVGTGAFLLSSGRGISTQSLAAVAVPFTELARGSESAIGRRANYLITSPDQFRELWEMVGAGRPMPDIDFSTNAVAAVFAGEKPTGGYDIAISGVKDAEVRTVTVTLTEPDNGCTLTQAITAPFQIVMFPSTTRKLVHEDISTTVGCPE